VELDGVAARPSPDIVIAELSRYRRACSGSISSANYGELSPWVDDSNRAGVGALNLLDSWTRSPQLFSLRASLAVNCDHQSHDAIDRAQHWYLPGRIMMIEPLINRERLPGAPPDLP
jgi:hypothetical protein